MIKIDKENFKIETDCKTVGEFMTEAAAFGCDRLEIKVDGCRYEFFDNPKIRVTDETPIGLVFIDRIGSGGITPDVVYITVVTKPKPKTVRKSGWINMFQFKDSKPFPAGLIYTDKNSCKIDDVYLHLKDRFVSIAKIEWEELEK